MQFDATKPVSDLQAAVLASHAVAPPLDGSTPACPPVVDAIERAQRTHQAALNTAGAPHHEIALAWKHYCAQVYGLQQRASTLGYRSPAWQENAAEQWRLALEIVADFAPIPAMGSDALARHRFVFAAEREQIARAAAADEMLARQAAEAAAQKLADERRAAEAAASAELARIEGDKLRAKLAKAGVLLLLDGDRIRVAAGALTDADRAAIHNNRAGMVAALADVEIL